MVETADQTSPHRAGARFVLRSMLSGALVGALCGACHCLIARHCTGDVLLECTCERAIKTGLAFSISILILLSLDRNEVRAYYASIPVVAFAAVNDPPLSFLVPGAVFSAIVMAICFGKGGREL